MAKKILVMGVVIIMCLGILAGCNDYGYQFHFYVDGENGIITIEDEALLRKTKLCKETDWCELKCPENSHNIMRLGSKKGSHELTFIAIPIKVKK